jgi:predicted nucleic acid-binding protein
VIVVDAMVIADLLLAEPGRASSSGVLEADPQWAAPILWRSEVANVLATRVRHGERTLESVLECFANGLELLEGKEHPVPHDRVLRACAASGCTAYDCEYVVLAEMRGVPLVTGDRQVLDAFPGLAVSPEAFVRRAR